MKIVGELWDLKMEIVGELLPVEMIDALLKIMDAKVATHDAKNSSDGGLRESIKENDLIDAFKHDFAVEAADVYRG